MLSPRAIAVQGLGSGTRLVAMQGLWPAGTAVAPRPRGGRGMPDLSYARKLQIGAEDELLMAATLAAWNGVLQ